MRCAIALGLALFHAVPAEADWTLGAYLGATRTMASALSLTQAVTGTNLTLRPVPYSSRSFESPPYYGLRAGYTLPLAGALAIEAEFIHSKVYVNTDRQTTVRGQRNHLSVDAVEPMAHTVQAFAISHGLNLLLVNLVARVPIGSPRTPVTLIARVGAGPTIPHAESTINRVHREQYEVGSIVAGAGGGVEFRLGRGVYALGEYKFTRTRQTITVAGGEASTLLRMHHSVFGLAYRF